MSSNGKIQASVFIITRDEENNLRRALESVKQFDEIVVVDSGSTDRTLEIAREYTTRVIHHNWPGYARQKEYAKGLCRNEWVLNIDADEEIDPELASAIQSSIEKNSADALKIGILENFQGTRVHPLTKHNAKVRCFKKSKGRYLNSLVHEGVTVEGRIAEAKGFINHYGESSVAVKVAKNNQYSTLRAEEYFRTGRHPSLLKLCLIFPFVFVKSFFLRRNCLNGTRGFIQSTINAFYAFLKEAKLHEKYTTKSCS